MNENAPAIDTRAGFVAALRWGFDAAFAQGARRIVCTDPDFADWPLDDAGLLQGLTDWLRRPQRRLVLLARGYDELPRRCPRFVGWRRAWAHGVEAWQAPQQLAAELPTLLASDSGASVQRFDSLHWQGRAAIDLRAALAWLERIDAVLQRSEPAFAANTLGL